MSENHPPRPDDRVDPQRSLRPTLPAAGGGGDFRTTDLPTVAGVDPERRGR